MRLNVKSCCGVYFFSRRRLQVLFARISQQLSVKHVQARMEFRNFQSPTIFNFRQLEDYLKTVNTTRTIQTKTNKKLLNTRCHDMSLQPTSTRLFHLFKLRAFYTVLESFTNLFQYFHFRHHLIRIPTQISFEHLTIFNQIVNNLGDL